MPVDAYGGRAQRSYIAPRRITAGKAWGVFYEQPLTLLGCVLAVCGPCVIADDKYTTCDT